MRRPGIADLMLLATVVIWSLKFTVAKYVRWRREVPVLVPRRESA